MLCTGTLINKYLEKDIPSEPSHEKNKTDIIIDQKELIFNESGLENKLTIEDIVKYINNNYLDVPDNKIELINKYIFTLSFDGDTKITFRNNESKLMNTPSIIIKLNNLLFDLDKKNIQNQIRKISNMQQFLYLFMNHTLKMLNYASEKTIDDKEKMLILKYSIGIMNRINIYTRQQIDSYLENIKNLSSQVSELDAIKNQIKNKLSEIEIDSNHQKSMNNEQKNIEPKVEQKVEQVEHVNEINTSNNNKINNAGYYYEDNSDNVDHRLMSDNI